MTKNNTETVDDFKAIDTGFDEESASADWLKPEEGMTIIGTLERAFFVPQDDGKQSVSYSLRGIDDVLFNIGERAGMRAIRECKIGDKLKIEIGTKGKLKSRDFWAIKVFSDKKGRGEKAIEILKAAFKDAYEVPF